MPDYRGLIRVPEPDEADQWGWEWAGSPVLGDCVQVVAAEPAFLLGEGRIKVGSGDPVEDVRKARKLMGLKDL